MILPLIQPATLDVAAWERDEFGVFPQGARAKSAYLSPDMPPCGVIQPRWRYLFKKSRACYPEQFWAEIVAYRIGCLMGVRVPPAFAAIDSNLGVCGALIEWFYDEQAQNFVWAGEFLQKAFPNFDRERGSTHNMQDNERLLRAMARSFDGEFRPFPENWRQWWVDALLFDALIGNTDRHQDNWGFVFSPTPPVIALAPLFDNGTSLGHERHASKFVQWSTARLDKYIQDGTHHVRWRSSDGTEERGHFELVTLALKRWPALRETACSRLNFAPVDMAESLEDLAALDSPVRLSYERHTFMLEILTRRHKLLQAIVR